MEWWLSQFAELSFLLPLGSFRQEAWVWRAFWAGPLGGLPACMQVGQMQWKAFLLLFFKLP